MDLSHCHTGIEQGAQNMLCRACKASSPFLQHKINTKKWQPKKQPVLALARVTNKNLLLAVSAVGSLEKSF